MPQPTETLNCFVLLDDTLRGNGSVLYSNPAEVIRCDRPQELGTAFAQLAAAQRQGKHLAGFFSFELGYLLEEKLAPLLPQERPAPLLWFGVFDAPRVFSPADCEAFLSALGGGGFALRDMAPSLDEVDYREAVDTIQRYIAAGDTYQVNYTFRMNFRFSGNAAALYRQLRQRQRVAHGAFIRIGEWCALSLSPELFFRIRGDEITARPMKGTSHRGATPGEDAERRRWLQEDTKIRAENVMIVDLLRNDLGRVCRTGSVRADPLFTIETYASLHQMTSQVTGRLRAGVDALEVVRKLFPCGSVTGAPKVRTMEIIRELEPRARGLYTGSIGYIAPDGDAEFNVAIRTIVLDSDGAAVMGLGSGIVHDSDPGGEYQESLLKGQFLSRIGTPDEVAFDLIETLRWEQGEGYYLLEEHLDRLQHSAEFFGFPCDRAAVVERLQAQRLSGVNKVRLLLHRNGEVTLSHDSLDPCGPLTAPDTEVRYVRAGTPVDSGDTFLYHKTTRRDPYDQELTRQRERCGCDEVLFLNERGEVTEGAWNNLFIASGNRLYTPPLHCGVLAGTFRRHLLAGKASLAPYASVHEKVLTWQDVQRADAVYFGNSVRGLRRARLVEPGSAR